MPGNENKTQAGSRAGGENKRRSGEVEIVVVCVWEMQQSSEGGNIIHFHANTLCLLHLVSLVVFCR